MLCRFLVLALLGLLLPGCARSIYPVKGRVHFADGSPVTTGRVVVEAPDGKTGSWGAIRADGSFQMGTFTVTDGVPVGTYKVFIEGATTKPPANLSERYVPTPLIHARYTTKGSTPLTFEVPRQLEWDILVEKPEP
jgi:hypothetical protein